LAQSFTFDDTSTGDETTTTEGSSEWVYLYDTTGSLYVEFPASWTEYDDRLWENVWSTGSGNINFTAAAIQASTDLDAFNDRYDVPGVDIAASKDWGKIGGYLQLLDGTQGWFTDDCTKEARDKFEDSKYEGQYDVWDCGVDSSVVVLAVRPISDPLAYLVLVQVQLGPGNDTTALERIWSTFDVVGVLP
jgi:hypothetical protein